MKNLRITLIAIAVLSFTIQSCSNEKKTEDKGQVTDQVKEKMEPQDAIEGDIMEDSTIVTDTVAVSVSKEQLEGMLSGYFSIKNALVNTNAVEAKSAAAKLMTSLGDGMDELSALVKGMSSKEDVEAIRKDFDQLSASMYQVVKANSDKKEAIVYKQYCPMAFNNQGAFWLSKEDQIANPYFGDKMLKCGKVQEEL